MDVVESQEMNSFLKMSRKIFLIIGEQDPTTNCEKVFKRRKNTPNAEFLLKKAGKHQNKKYKPFQL